MRLCRIFLLTALCAIAAHAAASVAVSGSPIGNGTNWLVVLSWTADGTGAVPATSVGLNQWQIAGYVPTTVEVKPGSPAPTAGYSLTIADPSGVDILGGTASSLSSTLSQSFSPSSTAPPLDTFTVTIAGQSVANARGTIYLFLAKTPSPSTTVTTTGGAVASVFGRMNAVTAQTGDYTAAEVTNAVDTTQTYSNPGWITALAASKLTGFSVNNDTNVTGAFAGGVFTLGWTGVLANARIANPFTTVNGVTCTLGSTCTVFSSISTLGLSVASPVVTIGANCSTGGAACAAITGEGTLYTFTAPATATISNAHTGTGYVSVDSSGVIQVVVGGASLVTGDVACSGCTVSSGAAYKNLSDAKLGTFTVTAGTAAAGTTPANVGPGSTKIIAGTNVQVTESSTGVTVAVPTGSTSTPGAVECDGTTISCTAGVIAAIGGGSSVCDPNNAKSLCYTNWFFQSAFNQGWNGVTYAGNCSSGSGASNGLDSTSIVQLLYALTNANNTLCSFTIPGSAGGNTNYVAGGIYDFLSGSTPKKASATCILQSDDNNGDYYCGFWVGNAATVNTNTFVGCRYKQSGTILQAVIRTGSSDVAVGTVTFTQDHATHYYTVTNSGGTANTITCSVDGGTAATAAGTVPAETYWVFGPAISANGVTASQIALSKMSLTIQ